MSPQMVDEQAHPYEGMLIRECYSFILTLLAITMIHNNRAMRIGYPYACLLINLFGVRHALHF